MKKHTIKIEYFKRHLKRHEDPRHGWVGVSLTELISLGINNKISSYSYIGTDCTGGKFVYLEKDCDLDTYLERLKELGIAFEIVKGTYSNSLHWIRSLDAYGTEEN